MIKFSKTLAAVLTLALVVLLVPYGSSLLDSAKRSNEIVLSKDNTLSFTGEVNGDLAGKVLSEVRRLDGQRFSKSSPIYLFMNTPGGSIETGLELIEGLNGVHRPINTITLFSASMGFQIVQNLGERLILKNGILMSHEAAGQIEGSFGGKRPSQMDSRYNLWLTRMQELDEQTVKRTKGKQTVTSYQEAYSHELWLTGSQAVAGGYADRIVTVRCDSSLDGATTHEVEFLGLKVSYDTDNCPINTSPINVRVDAPKEKGKEFTAEQKRNVRTQFAENYVAKQRSVIRMYWY